MKIFASVAALAAMIAVAPALSFEWQVTQNVQWEGTTLTTDELAAPLKGYLVYLGTDNTWSWTDDQLSDQIIQEGSVATAGLFFALGRVSGTYEAALGTDYDDGGTFDNGASYGVLLEYTDADGNVWYNIGTTIYTVEGVEDEKSSIAQQQFLGFSYAKDESTDATNSDGPTAGGGWWNSSAVIPEPMTVLCGLAGLALLLKRRA